MKVSYIEDLASHDGPESCVSVGNCEGEALTGGDVGRVSSRERTRHRPIAEQHQALVRRIRGHYSYFGVNDNDRSLMQLRYLVERAWYKWLNRRSQRSRLTWERFRDVLRDFPLPKPRVYVDLWKPL